MGSALLTFGLESMGYWSSAGYTTDPDTSALAESLKKESKIRRLRYTACRACDKTPARSLLGV